MDIINWIIPLGILIFSIILSVIAIYILRRILKTSTRTGIIDDTFVNEIKRPIKIVIILAGLAIGFYYINPDFKIDGISLFLLYKILAVVSLTYLITKIISASINLYVHKKRQQDKSSIDRTLFHLLKRTIVITLYVIALLVIFNTVGIKIGPVLAGLGIAGLAVALALQDTLNNFFSGLYLTLERPIKIGDYIELDKEHKGYVKEIGWRSTKLKTRENNIIIIPNSKLSQSTVINYHQPFTNLKVQIPLTISYKSDLNKVEKIIVQTAKKIRDESTESDKNSEPHIRFEGFGDSGINLTANIYSKDYENQFALKDKFMKAIFISFNKNKIEIPYPQRVIHRK